MGESEDPNNAPADPAAPQPDSFSKSPDPSTLPAPATRAQGKLGQPRGVVFVIVISLVTLGIYHLYWTYKSFEEMKRHTGEGIGGVLGLVIAIVFAPVNWFVLPSEVGKMYRGDGRTGPMTGWTGLWMLLPLIGFFVWTAKVQGALNRYWTSKAATAA
jgi:Domain of unknown function (DUF4234)